MIDIIILIWKIKKLDAKSLSKAPTYVQLKLADMRQSRFSKVNYVFFLLQDIISPFGSTL